MNRDFLSNFDRPAKPKEEPMQAEQEIEAAEDNEYNDSDYIRNLFFVWPDGREKFINYSRLDSGEISSENNMIRLFFGAEIIELTGLHLKPLLISIAGHKRKYVYCDDARYNDLIDDGPIVNEINIVNN